MNSTPSTDSTRTLVTLPQNTARRSKNTGRVRFIEKPSKGSRNSCGLKKELELSVDFHSQGTPLLVSSSLLRHRCLGQLDLSRLMKDREGWIIELGEVKSSAVGEEMMERFQGSRLRASQKFLSALFGFRSKLIRLVG